MQLRKVPKMWKEIRVNIMHKGGGKSKGNIGKYCPINVVSSLCKAFRFLNENLVHWVEDQQICGQDKQDREVEKKC